MSIRHVLPIALLAASPALALDWPNFRGPDHNGISRETAWSVDPNHAPKVLWKSPVGLGFSTVVTADGRAITTGHDGEKEGKDTLWCFDAASGKVLWKYSYLAPLGDVYFEGGTTGTPTIHQGKVFHLSRQGDCVCLDLVTGRIVWKKQLARELGLTVPDWGFASSPLVEGGMLILNAGDAGVALDPATGEVVWQNGKGMAGYATAVAFDLDGKRGIAIFTHRSCVAVEALTGKTVWERKFVSNYNTNAGAPVIHDGTVFLSAYNVPGVMLRASDGSPVPKWQTDTRVHFNAGVVLDGHLYTFHGQAGKKGGQLRCLDWKTGATKWAQEGLGVGSLLVADGKLICLGETGELVVAEATPKKFTSLARAKILEGKCWTVPTLSKGRLYARNAAGDLVCLEL